MDTAEKTADEPAKTEIGRLLRVMAALRDPLLGCPWDKEQRFETIAPFTIEEAYEVADAIGRGDYPALADELGDLLLQVVYHARLAEEESRFDFADVARAIADKMVRRHPHVFETASAGVSPPVTSPPVTDAWESQKEVERAARAQEGTLAGISPALPSLAHAAKLTARAARVGFDWPDAEAVLRKLDEEVGELRAELTGAEPSRLADEVGDLLFVLANLARKLDLDPEDCLRQANRKFTRRFGAVERSFERQGRSLTEASLDEMESAWEAAKSAEAARD
jgi:ATP diphosphatase